MNKPIDRNNRDEVLQQIGYTRATIDELNRKNSIQDKNISNAKYKIGFCNNIKGIIKDKISKKELYINELKLDLEKIKL